MRLLVFGGTIGSGGYIRYLQGLLTTGAVPADLRVSMLGSPGLVEALGPLDDSVEVIVEEKLSAPSFRVRKQWLRCEYPGLLERLKTDIVLYAAGRVPWRRHGVRAVSVCHNLLLFDWREIRRFGLNRSLMGLLWQRAWQSWSFQEANAVIFQSEYSQQQVLRQCRCIRQTAVIPHGVTPSFWSVVRERRTLGAPIRLLYVSSICPYKHHQSVVRATALLRERMSSDIRLELVGGSEPRTAQALRHLIGEIGAAPYVTLAGELPHDQLPARLQGADVFVFASSCETFGIALLEAMGAGLPIACSERTGLPSLLRDAGEYFDPESPESIARAVERLLADPERRQTCSEKAHQYSIEYTWRICAETTFNFIRSIGCDGS